MGFRTVAAAVAVVCVTHTALAYDPAPASVPALKFYDWTGVYVGANVAYGSATVSTPTKETIAGVFAGGQLGANYQFGPIVVGADVDGSWSSVKGDFNIPWLATARLRIGTAYDRIQYFATGGAATLKYTPVVAPGLAVASESSARTAWVAGVGSEFAVNQNVILQFELLYLQLLGSASTVPASTTSSGRVSELILRAGLSYKVNWKD